VKELKSLGWKVLTVWTCEMKDKELLIEKLKSSLLAEQSNK